MKKSLSYKQILIALFMVMMNCFVYARADRFARYNFSSFLNFDTLNEALKEDISKRNQFSRTYYSSDHPSEFMMQYSSSALNFRKEGQWQPISSLLKKKDRNLFTADSQPEPLSISLEDDVRINVDGKEKLELKNVALSVLDNGLKKNLPLDFSQYTSGNDGVKVIDVYPGIDLLIISHRGKFEIDAVLNRMPEFSGDLELSFDLLVDGVKANVNLSSGIQKIFIHNNEGEIAYHIDECFAYDANSVFHQLESRAEEGRFYVSLSSNIIEHASFPLVLDPIVTTSNSLAAASITDSRYNPVCWSNGCLYNLTVPTPANAEIFSISHSFEYYASPFCQLDQGGYRIGLNGCTSPSTGNGVYTSSLTASNATFGFINEPMPDLLSCLPAPSCASQNLNFSLEFFRCNGSDITCSSDCITASQPWIITIMGRTVEFSYLTPSFSVCGGSPIALLAEPGYGVPPYSFNWSTGSIDDTLFVNPSVTTSYSITVTDACGETVSGSMTVSVTPNTNPGFTINTNPACVNADVTFNTSNAFPASAYTWLVPGSNLPFGSISGVTTFTTSFINQGTYNVILRISENGCTFDSIIPLDIIFPLVPDVTFSLAPSATVCAGDTVSFQVSPTNGGSSPSYEWLVDGSSVQTGISDSFSTSTLSNGSLVQVVMTTSSGCAFPLTDTASLFIPIQPYVTPVTTILSDTIVCPNSVITFNVSDQYPGSNPSYQWYVNGTPIAGQTTSQLIYTSTNLDEVIGVIMTSSAECITSSIATDSATLSVYQNISPVVSLSVSPSGSICEGDTLFFQASSQNAGSSPVYSWFINTVNQSVTDSVLQYVPSVGDSVTVIITSTLACATVSGDTAGFATSVLNAVSPSVTLSVPSTIICSYDTLAITAVASGAGVPTYVWTLDGSITGDADSLFTASNVTDGSIIGVTVYSSLQCAISPFDTASVQITVLSSVPPSVNIITVSGFCSGDDIVLAAQTQNSGTPAFQWYSNGALLSFLTDTVVLQNMNDGDSISVFVTSGFSCALPSTASDTVILDLIPRVNPFIQIQTGVGDSICAGETVNFTSSVQNGGSNPVYQWYVSSIPTGNSSATFSYDQFTNGDVVFVSVTSDEVCLNTNMDTSNIIRINILPPLIVSIANPPLVCPGSVIPLTATISGGRPEDYQYLWSISSQDSSTLIYTVPSQPTLINLTVTDNCSVPAQDSVIVYPQIAPIADFTYSNPAPQSFMNQIQFTNLSTNSIASQWYFSSLDSSFEVSPLITFPQQGEYDVMLVSTSINGCTDTIFSRIVVKDELYIYIPNSFTPNNDGKNDFFRPFSAGTDSFRLRVYDRWGGILFDGSAPGWDGKSKEGNPVPAGIYVYQVDIEGLKPFTGKLTVVR